MAHHYASAGGIWSDTHSDAIRDAIRPSEPDLGRALKPVTGDYDPVSTMDRPKCRLQTRHFRTQEVNGRSPPWIVVHVEGDQDLQGVSSHPCAGNRRMAECSQYPSALSALSGWPFPRGRVGNSPYLAEHPLMSIIAHV